MSEITKKELLTFSNLANLEWQFADIVRDLGKDKYGKKETKPRKLNNALKPNLFNKMVRDEENGRWIKEPIYGGDGHGNYDYDKGKKEMREEAGIGMEYSKLCFAEKGEETPGDFMKDWEVIYSPDNYKIVA